MNNNMTKSQRDNRANQLNPNNIAYYKSRMASTSPNKSNNKSANKNIHNNKTVKNVTNVYHTHTQNNLGYKCPLCGRAGGLETAMFGKMRCKHCGGKFEKYRVIK